MRCNPYLITSATFINTRISNIIRIVYLLRERTFQGKIHIHSPFTHCITDADADDQQIRFVILFENGFISLCVIVLPLLLFA